MISIIVFELANNDAAHNLIVRARARELGIVIGDELELHSRAGHKL